MSIGDFCASFSALVWSGSVILMRVSGRRLAPVPLTFFKVWVAVAGFVAVLAWSGGPWRLELTAGTYLRLVVSAVLGISVADTMIAAALNRLGASLHALADCAYAPAMALVGYLMFGEMLGPWELLGGALVVSGVFVGAVRSVEVREPRHLWEGMVLAAAAHIIMAIGILMVRDVFREHSLVWVAGFRFAVAGVVLFLWVVVRRRMPLAGLFAGFRRRELWPSLIPMAVLGPFLATLFWMGGFKYLPAARAAIYNQLSTVFIILLAMVFLRERMTPRKWGGVALALCGALIVARH